MQIIKTLAALCLAIALLAPASGAAEELFLSVDFEPLVHSTRASGDVLAMPGADLVGNPGEPLLPRKTLYFLLPYGHKAVEVRLSDPVVEPLEGIYNIAPAQRPVPLSRMHLARPTPANPQIYGREEAFPGKWVETGSVQFKHGYAVLPVTVHPLSYRPKSGLVNRLVSATITLETGPGGRVSPLVRAGIADTDSVLRLADVVTYVNSYPRIVLRGPNQLPPGDYQYVIIAPQAFVGLAGPNSLEALRDARIASGLTAHIETVEWIQVNFDGQRPDGGYDEATRIRQFLTAAYNEWGTRYVLLVGDADAADVGGESGDNLIEVRGLYVEPFGDITPDHIPADMYYSCLDGSFDYNADGTYGEPEDGPGGGEVDLLAELYVGRAPADSSEEVSNFVAKTLAYENAAGNWLKDVWMVGEWLFDNPTYWGADDLDDLITGAGSGAGQTLGFNSNTFFEVQTLYDRPVKESWSAADLIPILNDGPHIMNHLGHSNVYYNMRMQTRHVDDLINVRPFLQYSQGCLNGSFDNRAEADSGGYVYQQDSISEHLLLGENGAFAAMVNSRYGLGYGYSHQFNRWFWHAFFSEGIGTIGAAFAYCKDVNAGLFAGYGYRWAGYTVNLLGDPASSLKKSINTADPILAVYPPGLTFHHMVGDPDPAPQEMRIRNDGVGAISFTAVADQPWINVSSSSGSTDVDLEVSVVPGSLATGTHEGVITVESADAPNSPVEMAVVLHVVEVPTIYIPHSLQAPELDGQISPGEYDQALTVPIGIEQADDVILYMQVSGRELFMSVSDFSDTSPGSWDVFYFLFDRDMDGEWPASRGADGEYILAAKDGGLTVYIPNVNTGLGRERDWWGYMEYPTGWRGKAGFQDGHRVWEAALDMQTSRLNVGTNSEFNAFIYSVNRADENTRYATCQWPAMVPQIDDQRYFGNVDLCFEGHVLTSAPLRLEFDAVVGQAAPAPLSLLVADSTGGNIAFTAWPSVAWIDVSPASGTTPDNLVVSLDTAGLGIGNYSEAVFVESSGACNSPYQIPVALQVWGEPPRLGVDPAEIRITGAQGAPNPMVTLAISNLGGQPLAYSAAASEYWIRVLPTEGSIGVNGAPHALNIGLLVSELTLGTHQGEITVSGAGAMDSPRTVPVQLEVVAAQPVPPVENLDIGVLDQALQLTWTCPDDPIVIGVVVNRGTGQPPATPDLGESIYDGMEERLTDDGLQNGTRYCYSAFAHDAAGRYAEPATACGIPGPNRKPPMPELLSPANGGAVPATPELVASTVVDPDGDVVAYTFMLLDSSGMLDSAVMAGSGNRVSWLPNAELLPEVAYRWQVEAVDDQGAHSGFAETRSFTIRPPTDGGPDGGQPGDDQPDCGCGHTNSAAPGLILTIAGLLFLKRRKG